MKKIKLFLFDVDGTLIDPITHCLPQSTIKSLKQLQQQGYYVGISSGRGLNSLIDTEVGNCISWDIYLCNNGQAIYDQNRKILKEVYIDQESVKQVLKVAKERKQPVFMVSKENFMIGEVSEDMIKTHEFLNMPIPKAKSYEGENVIMICAYDHKDYDYQAYNDIEKIKAIVGLSNYADIVLKDYNKYEGVKYALQYFQVDSYMAFGDSMNDYEMIQHATIGICMDNGCDELKQIATMVSKSVMEDGIEYALKYYHYL